jgi:predicted RNase H-like HicB family nuclease
MKKEGAASLRPYMIPARFCRGAGLLRPLLDFHSNRDASAGLKPILCLCIFRPMREIVFTVTPCADSGGYVARWDDAPGRGGITTQGDTLQELQDMVREAVDGYFEGATPPRHVRNIPKAKIQKWIAQDKADMKEIRAMTGKHKP